MTAKPLTRREFQERFHELHCPQSWDVDNHLASRLLATIEAGGFQPDPPTPYELDEWAARKIMGWSASASTWVKLDDTLAKFRNIIDMRDWKPSVNLGQALECVKQAGRTCQGVVHRDGRLIAYVDGMSVSQNASTTAELAEAIMRRLYSEAPA